MEGSQGTGTVPSLMIIFLALAVIGSVISTLINLPGSIRRVLIRHA